jgi:hypothetical protein
MVERNPKAKPSAADATVIPISTGGVCFSSCINLVSYYYLFVFNFNVSSFVLTLVYIYGRPTYFIYLSNIKNQKPFLRSEPDFSIG